MWINRQFTTIKDFEVYLQTVPRPYWADAVVLHHTWKPTLESWRGSATMRGMHRYYTNELGWSRYPHLFIAATGNIHEGVWLGNNLQHQGIHARGANDHSIGIEVVGNFDKRPWTPGVAYWVYEVLKLVVDWLDIDPKNVIGHREVPSPKTCPGRMVDMNIVRGELARQLRGDSQTPPPSDKVQYVITHNGLRVRKSCALQNSTDTGIRLMKGDVVTVDHILEGPSVYGETSWLCIGPQQFISSYFTRRLT